MAIKDIVYFDRPGPKNTTAVIDAVKARAQELEINYIVIASTGGDTGLQFYEAFKETGIKLISVTDHAGFEGGDDVLLSEEKKVELEEKGVKTLVCSHSLSGVERSITNKFGGVSHVEIIAHTLRQFGGEGIKVAVEVAIMAADAGLIPTNQEIIAVGGTSRGADTAVVLKTAHMNNYFDLEIREIIAKPRQRK